MTRSEWVQWAMWGSPVGGAAALRLWLLARRPPDERRPFLPLRLGRWLMQAATATGNLAYTRQLLANAKGALAAQAMDLSDAQAETARLRTENARLRAELASLRASGDGSTPAPTAPGGAKVLTSSSRVSKRKSPKSPVGSRRATSGPTSSEASIAGTGATNDAAGP